jgi:uridine nucleosidase
VGLSLGVGQGTHRPTPIWLDCDTGHDDAFAILVAAHSPDVRLLGISTVYGNAPLAQTTYNTHAILKAIGRKDVPVYAGAERPTTREPCFAPDIHGASGLDGTMCLPAPEVEERRDLTAVEAMRRSLMSEEKGRPWVVATGALTNVAVCFALFPEVVEHIAGLSSAYLSQIDLIGNDC